MFVPRLLRRSALGLLCFGVLLAAATPADADRLWKRFVPVGRVEADPAADYTLTQKNGPWLVMACTFSGEGAEAQARRLVLEFRQRFNLPAYVHAMEFKLDEGRVGLGVDKYGAPVRMKHRKGDRLHEWAVLVGDYPSVDDADAQKLLRTVKSLEPESLKPGADGETSQSLALARWSQALFVTRLNKDTQLGPMRAAFMARNPVLPQEYFTPKGVDKLVEKWNADFEHSLLNNPSKYTVRVATFTGKTILESAKNAPSLDSLGARKGGLEEAGVLAHELCEEMNRVGIKAYEFHDRTQSIVTVGGFEQAALRGADGKPAPVPAIAQIIRTFGAEFNTPEDPLQRAGLERIVGGQLQARRQQFNQQFAQQHGQTPGVMKPKFARVPPRSKNAKVIPFDIQPTVIEVPKKTISAGFAWGR